MDLFDPPYNKRIDNFWCKKTNHIPRNIDFFLLIESNSGCDGKLPGRDGEGCCTTSNTCEIGEGDCDSDSECTGNLVCGTDNCLSIFGHSPSDFDCCIEGKTLDQFFCISLSSICYTSFLDSCY